MDLVLTPHTLNWLGEEIENDYRTFVKILSPINCNIIKESNNSDIFPDHLKRMLQELVNLSQTHRKKQMKGIRSLLNGGRQFLYDSPNSKISCSTKVNIGCFLIPKLKFKNETGSLSIHCKGYNSKGNLLNARQLTGKITDSLLFDTSQILKQFELVMIINIWSYNFLRN